MKELDFIASAIDLATQKGAYNLGEASGLANALAILKQKLEAGEKAQQELLGTPEPPLEPVPEEDPQPETETPKGKKK